MSGRWLAIDTATDIASVAVGQPPGVEAAAHVQGARRHAAELLRLVDFCLDRAGARVDDLEGLVVADGPGSFTGLRIGWATVKGLAHETGLDVRSVPSLMAFAAGVATKLGAVPIAAWFDALRGQVYGAMYVVHPDRMEVVVPPRLLTPEEFVAAAPIVAAAVAGDGAVRYADVAARWSGRSPIALPDLPQSAVMLLSLLPKAGAATVVDDLGGAEPVYGRLAEAQVKWEARHGRPLPDPSRPTS